MNISQTKNTADCLTKINDMGLFDRCQCRLDHETALYLAKHGHELTPKKALYFGAKRIPSIPELLHCTSTWAKFFLQTPTMIWYDFIPGNGYKKWVETILFENTVEKTKNHPKPPLSRNKLRPVFRGGACIGVKSCENVSQLVENQ